MLMKKILVIRLSSIGDIILSSPLVRALHKKLPDARIDFVVKREFAELLEYHPFISTLYRLDTSLGFAEVRSLRQRMKDVGYDLVVDIHNNSRSIFLRSGLGARVVSVDKRRLERFLLVVFKINKYNGVVPVAERYIETVKEFGVENDGGGLDVYIPKETVERVAAQLKSLTVRSSREGGLDYEEVKPVIGFCPAAKHNTKMWLKENFIQLGSLLQQKYHTSIILFGGTDDVAHCSEIAGKMRTEATNLAGKLTLLEIAAAMDLCDVVVTNDTGLMHLAAARKRKVVAIFGPTLQEFGFFPYGTESVVIERIGLRCRPCSHIGSARCPRGHFKCMKEIHVEDVLRHVETVLKGKLTTVNFP